MRGLEGNDRQRGIDFPLERTPVAMGDFRDQTMIGVRAVARGNWVESYRQAIASREVSFLWGTVPFCRMTQLSHVDDLTIREPRIGISAK